MENKYLFLMTGALIALSAYFTVTSLMENKISCAQAEDCSLVETSCCASEKEYACFESNYALFLKARNLKCPLTSNGSCAAEFKTPPECACVQMQCATREKNDTAFKEQLKNLSYDAPEQAEWGK